MRPADTGYVVPPPAAAPPRSYVGPPVVMQGNEPTLGSYGSGDAAFQGIPGAEAAAARRAAAARYAQARFAQMRRVLAALPPELQAAVNAGYGNDPAAAWRAASAQLAQASRAAGYNDPRYYLLRVLPEILRQQQAQAANSLRGGV